jgi:hypothetical protein
MARPDHSSLVVIIGCGALWNNPQWQNYVGQEKASSMILQRDYTSPASNPCKEKFTVKEDLGCPGLVWLGWRVKPGPDIRGRSRAGAFQFLRCGPLWNNLP